MDVRFSRVDALIHVRFKDIFVIHKDFNHQYIVDFFVIYSKKGNFKQLALHAKVIYVKIEFG